MSAYTITRGSFRSTADSVPAIRKGRYFYGGGKAYSDIAANFRIEPNRLTDDDSGLTAYDIHGHVTGRFNVYSYRTLIGKIDTLNGTYWVSPEKYSPSTSQHQSAIHKIARELGLREI